jgi:hypothetical protein
MNPGVTHGRSFDDDYEEIGFVCDVESMRHPWKQFR